MNPNALSSSFSSPRSNAIEIALGQLTKSLSEVETRVNELRDHERTELRVRLSKVIDVL